MQNINTLADLIAEIESANNQFAVRFEPAYHPKPANVEQMKELCGVSYMTAETLCAMSFGLFQIMGDELIDLGLQVSPIQYCSMPTLQSAYFNKYCNRAGINYTLEEIQTDQDKRENFARKYNGPGNVAGYSARMLAGLKGA